MTSHKERETDNASNVKTQIYTSRSICRIDTHTDEGLQTSDHFSFHRLSLKRQPLSRLQRTKRKKKKSIVILMPSIVPRQEAEQKAKGSKQKQAKEPKEKAQTRRERPSRWHLILLRHRSAANQKEAERCPTSCAGLVPEHSNENVNSSQLLCTHAHTQIDAYAHIHLCLTRSIEPSLKT